MEERRIHDERIIADVEPVTTTRIVSEQPVATRRTITERRVTGGGPAFTTNPLALIIAAVLVVFILLLVFGAR